MVSTLLGLPFPFWDTLGADGGLRKQEKRTAEDFFFRMVSTYSHFGHRTATHTGYSTLGAAQGELPEGQERVRRGMTVPPKSNA